MATCLLCIYADQVSVGDAMYPTSFWKVNTYLERLPHFHLKINKKARWLHAELFFSCIVLFAVLSGVFVAVS